MARTSEKRIAVYDHGILLAEDFNSIDFQGSVSGSIDGNGNLTETISGGGAGVNFETPTGAINGVNLNYVVTHTPLAVILNGATYFENDGYTYNSGTFTITMDPSIVPQTGSTLRSLY
jgi:hypothetical protein